MRVASIPAAHPYVAGLGLGELGVELLPDPPVPGAPPGQWWPPVMLDPGWIAAHSDGFDLMHLHFGAESLGLEDLERVLAALARAHRPLVITVHDLVHPQLADSESHLAQLDRLLPAAAEIVTLTRGAAREIADRWGRSAVVVPHPAMRTTAPAASPSAPASPAAGPAPVVGVHLRDLRPGIDGPGAVATLAGALARLRAGGIAARGRVWRRDRVRDADAGDRVDALCAEHGLALEIEPRVADAALEAELAGLAVSLLPYRHGTHSGWLELCWDLGVPVAAPTIGHLADQHPGRDFLGGFAPGDADGLAAALRARLARPEARAGSPARHRVERARADARARERPRIAAAQLAVYRAALAGVA